METKKIASLASQLDTKKREAILEIIDLKTEDDMNKVLDKIDVKFGSLDSKFSGIDAKFSGMDSKFSGMDSKFGSMSAKFDSIKSEQKIVLWVVGIAMGILLAIIALKK